GSRVGQQLGQTALRAALHAAVGLSLADLGVAALSAVYMAARLAALKARLDAVAADVSDVKKMLTYGLINNGVEAAVTFLGNYDQHPDPACLEKAADRCIDALPAFRSLILDEARGRRRQPVL